MDRPTLEVADIFRRYGDAYRDADGPAVSTAQRRVMTAIETYRTEFLLTSPNMTLACQGDPSNPSLLSRGGIVTGYCV